MIIHNPARARPPRPSLSRQTWVPRLLPVTIIVMAILLAARSGEVVLAATNAAAAAQGASEAEKPEAKPAPPSPPPAGEKPATPAELPVTDSERSLLTDLRKRRETLDARAAALAAREATIAAIETRLNGRFDELKQLQARLEGLEQQRTARDEANWQGLVKVYEAMKPHDAATIFDDLDLPILLPVLDRMKESRAAPILAAMLPDRARLVTAELARLRTERNSITPPSPKSTPKTNAGG